jgi:hypothetical protein
MKHRIDVKIEPLLIYVIEVCLLFIEMFQKRLFAVGTFRSGPFPAVVVKVLKIKLIRRRSKHSQLVQRVGHFNDP